MTTETSSFYIRKNKNSRPITMLSFSQTRHLDTSSIETESPFVKIEFPNEQSFCTWLRTENEIVEWNLTKVRNAPNSVSKLPEGSIGKSSKRGRPTTIEWTKNHSCSFSGTSKARPEGTSERTRSRPTRKVGCPAKIKAHKLFSSDTVFVTHLNSHLGHGINDLQTWTSSRMSPATRNWLEKAVASGIEWKDIKRMTRAEVERANFLGGGNGEIDGTLVVPDILRISNQDFNNFRRKVLIRTAQLDSDCRQSLSKYAEMITQAGGFSIIQDVQEERVTDSEAFLFAFSSNWQVEILRRYNSLLFLDSTHNTCISLEDRHRKAFLYTILVKHDVAGCGIPVAFMVTNSETQWPLAMWLNSLRANSLLPVSPKFMIDCSATEIAAIESSFQTPQIRLCFWHMLRSMRTQVNSKIKTSGSIQGQSITQIRKSAVQEFLRLIYSRTDKEFGQIWTEYHDRYQQHEEWLKYIRANWLKHPERWWSGNRNGMLENNTNNYIEAWHNTLKSRNLGSFRKQRTDILIHLLLREVLPDFRIKVARVTLGLKRRRLNDSEMTQLKLCSEISSEKAASLVRRTVIEVGEAKHSEAILVRSFTTYGQEYLVSLNQASAIISCSCGYMTDNKSVCKHMFLAQSVFGYSISYDTRIGETSTFSETSLLGPTSNPLNETEARLESDDSAKALILEQARYLKSLATGSSNLNDIEKEALNVINTQIARIKRSRDSNERSWSKRQRR